jgi:hypothetical protein
MLTFRSILNVAVISLVWVGLTACKKEDPEISKGFIKYYGGIDVDAASDILQGSDGSIFILGTTVLEGKSKSDVLLLKVNNAGAIDWKLNFGDTLNHIAASLCVNYNGEIAVLSTREKNESENVLNVKLISQSGTLIWEKEHSLILSKVVANDIVLNTDGGFWISALDPESNNGDVWFLKLNTQGDFERQSFKPNFGPDTDVPTSILLFNNDIWAMSQTSTLGGLPRVIAIRQDGSELLANLFNSSSIDPIIGRELVSTPDNQLLFCGQSKSGRAFVSKFSPNLNSDILWYSSSAEPNSVFESVCMQSSGSATAAGTDGTGQILLTQFSETGQTNWTKSFGGAGQDKGVKVINAQDGGFLILGVVEFGDDPEATDNTIVLIKTDQNGEIGN